MTAPALLTSLRAQGVQLQVEGENLRWTAPPGVMTPQIVAVVKEVKPALVALLSPAGDSDRVLGALHEAGGPVSVTWLYQELRDMPLERLRAILAELLADGRVTARNQPLPGLEKRTVYTVAATEGQE